MGVAKVTCPTFEAMGQIPVFHRTYFLYLSNFSAVDCKNVTDFYVHSADRSDNFIIGLTNVSVLQQPPVLGNYAVCGQYPGPVPAGATVSLQCSDTNLPPARYVIVQFPTTDFMNFCELDVCVEGRSTRSLYSRSIIIFLRCGSLRLC